MRTIAYVDGYNLYFGSLKYTRHKWLDVFALLKEVLRVQDPNTELVKVKFFTASILAKMARQGNRSVEAQNIYHRALELSGVEVFCGRYSLDSEHAILFAKPPNKDNRVKVWRLEEKQTDVKIALHMYRDVCGGAAEQVVLVTNDSDLSPVLGMLRHDYPQVRRGVIFPRREPDGVAPDMRRPPSGSLRDVSDWSRDYIREDELAGAQFRDPIHTGKKPLWKPAHW